MPKAVSKEAVAAKKSQKGRNRYISIEDENDMKESEGCGYFADTPVDFAGTG